MTMRGPDGEAPFDQEGDDDEGGFDLETAKDLAGFVWRAPRRNKKMAVFTFLASVLATIAVVALFPRSYTVEVKILAQKNLVLPALGNPNRAVPREADNPTRNVADQILQHDNLVALVKQTDMIDRWEAQRPPLLALKDKALGLFMPPLTDDDKLRALVGVLEKKLRVEAEDNNIVLTVDWPNPEMAFEIISLVQKNFFEARYDGEVGTISDAIRILEDHAKEAKQKADDALAVMQQFQKPQSPSPSAATAPAPQPPRPRPQPPTVATQVAPSVPAGDPTLVKQLADKRAAIALVETTKAKRLEELNKQLADDLVTMAPMHPQVVALKQTIAAASVDPPELAGLRSEEAQLVAQLGAAAPPPTPNGATPRAWGGGATPPPIVNVPPPQPDEDPQITVARQNMTTENAKYADLIDRIDAAQIELDVQRAAFKYRFSVTLPAEVPKKPSKPNVIVLVLGGILASLFLPFLLPALRDLAGGRFIEEWQVRRQLDIPLLGEVSPP